MSDEVISIVGTLQKIVYTNLESGFLIGTFFLCSSLVIGGIFLLLAFLIYISEDLLWASLLDWINGFFLLKDDIHKYV